MSLSCPKKAKAASLRCSYRLASPHAGKGRERDTGRYFPFLPLPPRPLLFPIPQNHPHRLVLVVEAAPDLKTEQLTDLGYLVVIAAQEQRHWKGPAIAARSRLLEPVTTCCRLGYADATQIGCGNSSDPCDRDSDTSRRAGIFKPSG